MTDEEREAQIRLCNGQTRHAWPSDVAFLLRRLDETKSEIAQLRYREIDRLRGKAQIRYAAVFFAVWFALAAAFVLWMPPS